MIERFFPDMEVNKVEDISIDDLRDNNIKAIILDIDNTICEWKMEPAENVKAWLGLLKRNGIQICLVSNNKRYRVEKIGRILEINSIHSAIKPSRKGFLSAISIMNVTPEETAVIGDQIFTDIYGGNRLNMLTIYVKPICDKDYLFVRMKRPFERFILRKYKLCNYFQKEKRMVWKIRSRVKKYKSYEV
ncbi:MAG: YqeG family HAD IIIA-type phosphatase [Ignavibacteriales bacterium]